MFLSYGGPGHISRYDNAFLEELFDPVGEGLIASLARPGGNITGLVLSDLELEAKRLEVLLETFPRLSRVAYLDDPTFVPPELNVRMKEAVHARTWRQRGRCRESP